VRERELDTLDLEIDNGVTSAITEVQPAEARELLACFVSGRPVRHVLIAYDKPVEQMFIDYLRRRDHKG
jgi:hypothetical protein